MNKKNSLTDLLRIRYPIIQAPMLGITTPQMAAAASNTGALGSLPLGGLAADTAKQLIQKTRSLTDKPFAVNLFVYDYPQAVDAGDFETMQQLLQQICNDHNIPYQPLSLEDLPFHSYKDLLQVIIEEKVPIVSFTFGIPTDQEIALMHQHGIILQGTATSEAEIRLLNKKDVDIIVLQGTEAGGHRGSFLQQDPLPQVPLLDLLKLASDVTNKPIVAAGGLYNKDTIRVAMQSGAQAVQLGTIFITSDESAAVPAYKEAVLNSNSEESMLTRTFTGRWARCIPNEFTRALETAGLAVPPYPVQNVLTTSLRNWAKEHNNEQFIFLLAGKNAAKAQLRSTAEIITSLVED
ncbi:MAG: nitronate monooxygenase [Chitinophagaceae bacterium]